ncbi:TD and POZ domain-containing protein 4-like [Stegodyphus dumicola]|uniref:TD and POZ domain-containing protein 4-like n=1 Tax=Stegodyphus dumicola TaxID=202533 RepID=UPI0015B22FD1|nr:TD and POZ domain-containing protein 4-like [Stegodyphus dumicola]
MQGYHLTYHWDRRSQHSFYWTSGQFRSLNNPTVISWNFYINRDSFDLLLHRSGDSENITLKGFVVLKCRTNKDLTRTITVDCSMEIDCDSVTVASLFPMYNDVLNCDIDCFIYVSKCKEYETKSVQCDPVLLGFDSPRKLFNLDETGHLDTKTSSIFLNDMRALYDKQHHADFVLFCDDREFRAHKCILSARSPVFAQMFQNDTIENTENKIIVKDVDPCILENLLRFIYTGRIKQYTYAEACDLYYASDKYAVLDLQDICREIIISSLSTSTVFEVLALADKHTDEKLLNEALTYIASVFQEIKLTDGWTDFQKQNLGLANQVLSSVVEVYSKLINNA